MKSWGLALIAVLVAAAHLPAAAAQDQEDADVSFFLHAMGDDCAEGAFETYMDTEDAPNDLDGCGTVAVGAGPVTVDQTFPGTEALGFEVADGSTATAHIFITTQNPSDVTVATSLAVGKARCSGSDGPKQVTGTPGISSWTEFVVPCEFGGKFGTVETSTVDAKPGLTVSVTSTVTHFYGYEGDHASRIDFFDLAFPGSLPAANNTTAPDGGEETPMPALPLIVAGVLAAVVAVRRRR